MKILNTFWKWSHEIGKEGKWYFYSLWATHKLEVHLRLKDNFIFSTMYKVNLSGCHIVGLFFFERVVGHIKVCFFTQCGSSIFLCLDIWSPLSTRCTCWENKTLAVEEGSSEEKLKAVPCQSKVMMGFWHEVLLRPYSVHSTSSKFQDLCTQNKSCVFSLLPYAPSLLPFPLAQRSGWYLSPRP